jgi:hypothetical protein
LAVGIVLLASVQAPITIDMAGITCERLLLFKVTDPNYISICLNGCDDGKEGRALDEPLRFKDNIKMLKGFRKRGDNSKCADESFSRVTRRLKRR